MKKPAGRRRYFMELSLEQIVGATGGKVIHRVKDRFTSYHIDSRKIKPGGLFFALKGESTDGHLFVSDAFQHGAAGAVVKYPADPGGTLVQVPDSLKALHDAAVFARNISPAKYTGITGSSGKTSTKEFVASLLAETYRVFKSEGNLNSLTGMPLSLLSMESSEYAVFEVAMNRPGEIQTLSSLLRPDIGVLLNVNPVHLGQFSSVSEIADEKCSLLQGMSREAVLIYNFDDALIAERVGKRQNAISYGLSPSADLQIAEAELLGVSGSRGCLKYKSEGYSFETELCGTGNLYNIAAAAAVAIAAGLPLIRIARAISKLQPYQQRGILIQAHGVQIYDDSYNSNPRALEFAFDLLAHSKGFRRRIAVVGDMLELGPAEEQFHRDAGKQAATAGIDVLIATGPLCKVMAASARENGVPRVFWVATSKDAAQTATEIRRKGDLFLVKGSRGMKMETVTEALKVG